MLAITIRFLNGSYHATPWGKNVNEGLPEWPPSLWRFVRAMIATWKRSLPEQPEEVVWPIFQKLLSELPSYYLPPAQASHSRHYVPADGKDTLIMDTYVITGNQQVEIIWDKLNLDATEISILESILAKLHYLGRAESWCAASVSGTSSKPNCIPFTGHEMPNSDLVYVLVPKRDVKFVDTATRNIDPGSITVTTAQLHALKYTDPPGGVWVPYLRDQSCFEIRPLRYDTGDSKATLFRYAVVGKMRPLIRDTLKVGDIARVACMSKYGTFYDGKTSPIFSGKDMHGKPLTGHGHAFYLPTYETQNREIDHITIIAPSGFGMKELSVLTGIKQLYSSSMQRVNLIFQGCGTVDDFSDVIPILKKSRKWVSSTPLILSRHPKYRGKKPNLYVVDDLEEQVRRDIKNRYDDSYVLESVRADLHLNIPSKPFDFYRWRRRGRRGFDYPYMIQLEFEKPVRGPITLGYASHYGLGMFVPAGGAD